MKDLVLFGAGRWGWAAVQYYGKDHIRYFMDNNEIKQGTHIYNIPVISLTQFMEMDGASKYRVVITSRYHTEMEKQLRAMGISDYQLYSMNDDKQYYPTAELILNTYEESDRYHVTEEQYNAEMQNTPLKKIIREKVEELYKEVPLFDHIEIETINRCNGVCSFCPVNTMADPREKKVMSEELFEKITDELSELGYRGRIALFSNNEPLLDERIVELYRRCRNKLPKAWLHMFTNGTLLTLEKFMELIPLLNELVIDNYNRKLELIPNSKIIAEYCQKHEELKKKVTIVVRRPDEILSSRGGDAPNRRNMVSHADETCILPFRQMIVRPDGKVSLCCNDPLGKNTMGDLTKESLTDVWYGPRFQRVRQAVHMGRAKWEHCMYCDMFSMG